MLSGACLWRHQWLMILRKKFRFSASIHVNSSIAIPSGPACLLFFVVLRAWSNSSLAAWTVLHWIGLAIFEGHHRHSVFRGVVPMLLLQIRCIVSALSFGATSSPFKSLSIINCGCGSLRDPYVPGLLVQTLPKTRWTGLDTTPPLINLYSWQSSNPLKPFVC